MNPLYLCGSFEWISWSNIGIIGLNRLVDHTCKSNFKSEMSKCMKSLEKACKIIVECTKVSIKTIGAVKTIWPWFHLASDDLSEDAPLHLPVSDEKHRREPSRVILKEERVWWCACFHTSSALRFLASSLSMSVATFSTMSRGLFLTRLNCLLFSM